MWRQETLQEGGTGGTVDASQGAEHGLPLRAGVVFVTPGEEGAESDGWVCW